MKTDEIIKAARERLGIEELTPMQQSMATVKAPAVILVSPTGSGKTLACALPLLGRISGRGNGVQAAVIAPSRELAVQISGVIAALAPNLRVVAVYGGHPMTDETRSLQSGVPDVIVGTPGRLLDHIHRHNVDLTDTPQLLLDEYDKSLELGFESEMKRIVKTMRSIRFTLLSSATAVDELPEFMRIHAPMVMDFSAGVETVPQIEVNRVASPVADKLDTLERLLRSLPRERTMVFVNHRESAERVHSFLKSKKFPAALYHGALDQYDRETAIDLFTNGTSPILVCTDLAARGLDIAAVESVIHYHMPVNQQAWTHRCGRTARMGATGHVYVITGPGEECPYAPDAPFFTLAELSAPWRRTVMTLWFHEGKKEKLSRGDVVGALIHVAGLAPDSIGLISVHDHRILAAVPAQSAASVAAMLSASRIKSRRIRVTLV
ncbi:MAG: DEAD/DEAH box helicase [Muribaculaceae bacterium]|nr:DEAD/DEAH box helicase [Muribaculaceae bacterium]MDE6315519.1 DEAD/DEAH box helicase [Muribaculaceae bacterium]